MSENCIFCAIIAGKIPAKIIDQTDDILVVQDIAPKAPIHYLILPKRHIKDMASLGPDDASIAANIFYMAQKLSKKLSGSQSFRLLSNNGSDVGQSVFHLHVHFLSGKKMSDF